MATTLKLEELKDALLRADPAAVLVSQRVLSRVIQQVRKLPRQYFEVPHRKTFVVDRHDLFRHVEQDELELDSDRLLPPTVLLLARPTSEKLAQLGREATLLKYWRRLFHAEIDLALGRRFAEGRLSPPDVQARLEQIGRTEFEEIRRVLKQEGFLFPQADDREVYSEFAAVYLELRFFLPNLRSTYFPAIRDFDRIDALLAEDVDAEALFRQTRLAGAPEPEVKTDKSADESNDYYWRLMRAADRAERASNLVRAAILRTRAARVAPGALTLGTRTQALADLQRLTDRLQAALKLSEAEAAAWQHVLPALLEKADQGPQEYWTVESRLLYDLQKVCIDNEKDLYALGLVEWALSGGKRPIKRPLPSQRIVRISKHLRAASQRLTTARLSDSDREKLAALLHTAVRQSEERLRARFRPILTDAFCDVGLVPTNAPERVAFNKMVEELLDRIAENGFVTFSDLRDAISRNNLKLPDHADPQEFVRGDPLLRLDRRLSALMDGVYRPSDLYLRLLERFTSLVFGTGLGRWITWHVVLPLGGAALLLDGPNLMLLNKQDGSGPLFGPLSWLLASKLRPVEAPPPLATLLAALAAFGLLSFFLYGVIHVDRVRRRLIRLGQRTWAGVRFVVVELPVQLARIELLRRLWLSWPWQLFLWYLFKPLLAFGILALLFPDAVIRQPLGAVAIFLALTVLVNSRFGQAVSEFVVEAFVHVFDWLRADFLQGLFRLIVGLFKRISDAFEYVLYSVDEWLRFRSGEGTATILLRAVLGVLWFPIGYLARMYFVLLLEPTLNPLKLPISSLAYKLMLGLPWYRDLAANPLGIVHLSQTLSERTGSGLVGYVLAAGVVLTLWLLPSVCGFLVWEIQENWRLFRANRSSRLRPVRVGQHGETLLQLLKPGFHSGTLPKLYGHLRRAERRASKTGIWRQARAYRHQLEEVEEAVRLFAERELLALLHESSACRELSLAVGAIELASNRIAIELVHPDHPQVPLRLSFEEKGGLLVASIAERGWLPYLQPDQIRDLNTALAGFYKLAGVDVVQEQLQAQLPPAATGYEIADRRLVVRFDAAPAQPLVLPIQDSVADLSLPPWSGAAPPLLDPQQVFFSKKPLLWQQWVQAWQNGDAPAGGLGEELAVLPGTSASAA